MTEIQAIKNYTLYIPTKKNLDNYFETPLTLSRDNVPRTYVLFSMPAYTY